MKIKQAIENGNSVAFNSNERPRLTISIEERTNWYSSDNTDTFDNYNSIQRTDNLEYNKNSNYKSESVNSAVSNVKCSTGQLVCNKQYRLESKNRNFLNSFRTTESNLNLEGSVKNTQILYENFAGDIKLEQADVSTNALPIEEEQAFDHSDIDEMSENGVHLVPRGIVNPNYPGFQHLAHTLQDYSSNIEKFYQSENDMTDDDVDLEISDITYEHDPKEEQTILECINNINNNCIKETKSIPLKNDLSSEIDSHLDVNNEIPDLIKTVSKNNNNFETDCYDLHYTDTDIENNFQTNDIIGNFNKEIEDEIKKLLNYNINIQDDLEELRKDIKETFAKPIENTINNISDVVNHVIKKLVETHSDDSDHCDKLSEICINKDTEEINDVDMENEMNINTERNLSRPTFLLLETDSNSTIADAFLSDAKEEIHIYENEYDIEKIHIDVENTIKQLSSELKKIIPKLDEMRENDKVWNKNYSLITDGNCNKMPSSSKCCSGVTPVDVETRTEGSSYKICNSRRSPLSSRVDFKFNEEDKLQVVNSTKERFSELHNITSVRRNEIVSESDLGSFDVYNIETALPKLDLDAIENHLKAAKEAERRKRNDREEIRRRLAMGADTEEYYSMGHIDRPGRKPSLQSRLQNGMNLQICFMNETASDNESQASDLDRSVNSSTKSLTRSSIFSKSNYSLSNHPYQTRPLSVNITKNDKCSTVHSGSKLRPTSLTQKSTKSRSSNSLNHVDIRESDFYALQATLQTEARIALAQAKEMARIQMERSRRARAASPVTEMLQRSMQKANAPLAPDRRRVSRQLLTDMNIAQLQVIVNELHGEIETLNERLVQLLMARDELHMGQDSMLVDIEDLTRYLGVKEQTKKTKGTKSGVRRLASLVHK